MDNAAPHRPKETKLYLDSIGIPYIDWPAHSPDLSPVEHMWQLVRRGLEGIECANQAEFDAKVIELWEGIP